MDYIVLKLGRRRVVLNHSGCVGTVTLGPKEQYEPRLSDLLARIRLYDPSRVDISEVQRLDAYPARAASQISIQL